MNLLLETRNTLKLNGKTSNDVLWVGRSSINAVCSWDEFVKQAKNIEYDNSYGIQEIPADLVVAGADWWLERAEYDGAEWWQYKTFPTMCSGKTHNLELNFTKEW